jgi:hypothetical protein
MKSYKELYFISVLLFCLSSCQHWEDEKFVATVPKKCNYNVIGISGPSSEEPYVEIQYNKDDDNGNNVRVSERVSPPFLFGGQKVNILCDSILYISGTVSYRKYRINGYELVVHHSYEETDGEYLRIVNHSTDKIVEFFIAGTREMETEGKGCRGIPVIKTMPAVYYKHAPIYYLLFPDKKYKQNVQGNSSDCNDIFYFEGNRCVDLIVERPWSVDEVMNLYRSEYRNSPDIKLDIEVSSDYWGRMTEVVRWMHQYQDMPFKSFYGTILPGEVLRGNISLPLLATQSVLDDRIDYYHK